MSSTLPSSSTSVNASRATLYTVLNASLEKLQKSLEALEQNVEVTVIQSEWSKRLLTIHSSILMASTQVLTDNDQPGQRDDDQDES
ncbi:hypothetical protein BGZ68_003959 [Mortierella alpina]|nr:hypothetical protein BGZ68_003959 [Mortierella alpina]